MFCRTKAFIQNSSSTCLKNAIKYKAVLNQNMKFYLEISSKNLQLCPTANKTLLREITVN